MPQEKQPAVSLRERIKHLRRQISSGALKGVSSELTQIEAQARQSGDHRLGPDTILGLPRKLHAAHLALAKAENDSVRRAGLQYTLVPPPELLRPLVSFDDAERRLMIEKSRQPVPGILHQIWIGSLPVPPSTIHWASYASRHGFQYRLWREEDLSALKVDKHGGFRAMIEEGDYPGAVDVARYAILHEFGGIYLDCDWFPAREDVAFQDILPLVGLSALPEDVPRDTGMGSLLLTNSFIAAPPGHPVFRRILDVMPDVMKLLPKAPAWWSTGPLLMTLVFRGTNVTLPDESFVAALLPRQAPFADVEAAREAAITSGRGLLIGWKSW
ncbi:glycosyltransferase family 32 protein [Rhizobium oryzicola]|uniref:Glycosyltransferase n=1 Tax=Rhizobium oryzicola TaxID=1232668 RepID=A0ABT8SX99_9HYPH|nr:glycosyltransferase [Rhizobium oryzicola]MDO1582920.1 glycosyltransferase [Rhizobium oryzicola]